MSDLTDKELALALNGECHSVEVVVWLAREVKRSREAQRAAVSVHEDVRGIAIRALDRHLIGDSALGVVMRNRIAETIADEVGGLARLARVKHAPVNPGDSAGDSAPKFQEIPEIFPFVTALHCEVLLRHKDGVSQDIEMTPDEADRVAYLLRAAADGVSGVWYGAWPQEAKLLGNAPVEIFPFSRLHRTVVLWHKDGESSTLELTSDEADLVADQLCAAAAAARVAKVET